MSSSDPVGEVPPQDWLFHFETGRLCLDFVATVGDRAHLAFDRWRTPNDLGRWCVEAGLLRHPPSFGMADLRAARALREVIYAMIRDVRAKRPLKRSDVERLNDWSKRPPLAPRLHVEGRAVSWQADRPLEAVLAMVGRDAIELLSSPQIDKLRECAGATCSVVFLDLSRPGARRWCSMERCGNRAKKADFRKRHGA
jgi:predicted RNA-binding Zn ribbon-like protein